MQGISLKNLTGLIIDDQPEMCRQLQSMLKRFGLNQVTICGTGEQGIKAISSSKYDIILCDYNLGARKNGLQLLEEVKFRGILCHTSCFIIITAVQTGDIVASALEHQPDAYLVKPITFVDLRLRLERTLHLKNIFHSILHPLDLKNYDDALAACDQLAKAKPKMTLNILKYKATILLTTNQYQQAEILYNQILKIRKLSWADYGLAKAMFHQEKLTEAAAILHNIIHNNNNDTQAYDLLAIIKEMQGDIKGAQRILQSALEYSPLAMLRQTSLSRIATVNKDWLIVSQSSRKAIELGRYSIFKNAENYIHLSASLKPQLDSRLLSDRRTASNEIFKTMASLKKDFEDDATAVVCAYFIEGSTHKKMGQESDSEKHIIMANNLLNSPAFDLKKEALEIISNRISLACDQQTLKDFIESDISKNLSQQAKDFIDKKKNAIQVELNQEKIDQLNNTAVGFFENGALIDAIQLFEKATAFTTASYSILLNATQAYIAFLEQNQQNHAFFIACDTLFERLNAMPEADRRQARKKRLESIYNSIKKRSNSIEND